jgi:hypothetical protein
MELCIIILHAQSIQVPQNARNNLAVRFEKIYLLFCRRYGPIGQFTEVKLS